MPDCLRDGDKVPYPYSNFTGGDYRRRNDFMQNTR